jgi:hypothetical protein
MRKFTDKLIEIVFYGSVVFAAMCLALIFVFIILNFIFLWIH